MNAARRVCCAVASAPGLPGRRGQRRVGPRRSARRATDRIATPCPLSSFLMKVKRTKNIFHYDFLFLVFLFLLSSFEMLGFACSHSPWGKLTSCTFGSRNHFAATNVITRLTNRAFQVQFALKKFDVILFISRISSIVYGT